MSMIRCKATGCGFIIDSDDDPDCFVEIGNMRRLHKTVVLCEACRDEREADKDRFDAEIAKAESEAEAGQ